MSESKRRVLRGRYLRTHIGAFTLMELIVSMSVMTVLLGGLMSVILVATHAIPDDGSPIDRTMKTTHIVDDLDEDMRFATSFTDRQANTVTFVVPDRDSDSTPETISYSWSGVAGDPLKRQYNGGTAVSVAEDVNEFYLTYDVETVAKQNSQSPNESAETVLFNYTSASQLGNADVQVDQWWGQYFMPTLPADTVSWKVTRVLVMAKQYDDSVDTAVQLRLPNADLTPGDSIVDSATINYTALTSSYNWVETTFSSASGLRPDAGLCVTISNSAGNSCKLQYQTSNVSLPGAALSVGKPSWQSPATDAALLFFVYGTVTTQGEPVETNVYYLNGVRVSLRLGDGVHVPVNTRVDILNRPVVATP